MADPVDELITAISEGMPKWKFPILKAIGRGAENVLRKYYDFLGGNVDEVVKAIEGKSMQDLEKEIDLKQIHRDSKTGTDSLVQNPNGTDEFSTDFSQPSGYAGGAGAAGMQPKSFANQTQDYGAATKDRSFANETSQFEFDESGEPRVKVGEEYFTQSMLGGLDNDQMKKIYEQLSGDQGGNPFHREAYVFSEFMKARRSYGN
jgi:hypothetical protein